MKSLTDLKTGEKAMIVRMPEDALTRHKLISHGIQVSQVVTFERTGWKGDPICILLNNRLIILRKDDASRIFVSPLDEASTK